MRTFAISDIHGCAHTFEAMISTVIQLKKEDSLYLLGDYIDRGPRSKEVLDIIMGLQSRGYNVYALKGNHEEICLRSFDSEDTFRAWMINGGDATLKSFSATAPYQIPQEYIKFMSGLALYKELNHYLLVHAGFNFNSDDPFADKQSMLWTRNFKVKGNKVVVHGHTPTVREEIEESILNVAEDKKIDIDNGCAYISKGPEFGCLCCLQLDNLQLYFQSNIDS